MIVGKADGGGGGSPGLSPYWLKLVPTHNPGAGLAVIQVLLALLP